MEGLNPKPPILIYSARRLKVISFILVVLNQSFEL